MPNVKLRGINRNDALEELAHTSTSDAPPGLRQVAHDALYKLEDSEVEMEFISRSDYSGVSASVTVKVLGPARRLPMTYTRDQITEARNQGRSVPKD
jgi:hypothetical protein